MMFFSVFVVGVIVAVATGEGMHPVTLLPRIQTLYLLFIPWRVNFAHKIIGLPKAPFAHNDVRSTETAPSSQPVSNLKEYAAERLQRPSAPTGAPLRRSRLRGDVYAGEQRRHSRADCDKHPTTRGLRENLVRKC